MSTLIWRPGVLALCVGSLIGGGALQPAWAQKTDTVVMLNGDRVTVEIKKLERGRLEASTDGMGTLLIEWDDIEQLSSPRPIRGANSEWRSIRWVAVFNRDGTRARRSRPSVDYARA